MRKVHAGQWLGDECCQWPLGKVFRLNIAKWTLLFLFSYEHWGISFSNGNPNYVLKNMFNFMSWNSYGIQILRYFLTILWHCADTFTQLYVLCSFLTSSLKPVFHYEPECHQKKQAVTIGFTDKQINGKVIPKCQPAYRRKIRRQT